MLILMSLALAAQTAPTAEAPPPEPTARDAYEDCIRMSASDPTNADRLARQWISQEGGAPARHCLAMTQLHQEKPDAAAATLVEAARIAESEGSAFAADLYGQAGNAALLAGDAISAEQHFDQALIGAARGREDLHGRLLIDRALARTEQGKIVEARADLLAATRADRNNLDAWLLLAATERRAGNMPAAESAIQQAIRLAPDNSDVLEEAARIAVEDE